jgi:hypothetical protein
VGALFAQADLRGAQILAGGAAVLLQVALAAGVDLGSDVGTAPR